jgi:hypothetical protein
MKYNYNNLTLRIIYLSESLELVELIIPSLHLPISIDLKESSILHSVGLVIQFPLSSSGVLSTSHNNLKEICPMSAKQTISTVRELLLVFPRTFFVSFSHGRPFVPQTQSLLSS